MARTSGTRGGEPASTGARIKDAAITGLALIIPLVVTILVLLFVWGFIASLINPISVGVASLLGLTSEMEQYVLLALTTISFALVIVVIGLIANNTDGSTLEDTFDAAIGSIPGVGAVYSSFNEMSQMLLDSDTQSFQEVVLVEYPDEGSYSVAFLTSDTPGFVRDLVGEEEMITAFMPLGPNPFMGGFVLHLSTDRVHDIDMSVEEGIQSIVTSGVAMGDTETTDRATALDHGTPDTTDVSGGYDAVGGETMRDHRSSEGGS